MASSKVILIGSAVVGLLMILPSGRAAAEDQTPAAAAESSIISQKGAPPSQKDLFFSRDRHLLYIALPGTLEGSAYRNGLGIVVLDVDNNYSFVKRITTWDVPASRDAQQVAGVTASPVTNMIYVAARDRLGAFDLATDKMVWQNSYDGKCCERPQITPDGKLLVVGSNLRDFWYVVNPMTGKLIAKIQTPLTVAAHNLNLSPDGKLAFMSSTRSKVLSIGDLGSYKTIKTVTFDDAVRPFVLNHDATRIYANINNFLGFEVGDVETGKVIERVEVPGFGWRAKWDDSRRGHTPHNCPGHGIALIPDEKELWVVDVLNNYVHVFDNTKENPVLMDSIKTTAWPLWITIGLDGKFAYISSGDIIDVKTHKIIGQMRDEYGRQLASEKLLDMTFTDGVVQRVSNQFGNGLESAVSAAAVGASPATTDR